MDPLERELLDLRKRIAARAGLAAPEPEAGEAPAEFYRRALAHGTQSLAGLPGTGGAEREAGNRDERIAAAPSAAPTVRGRAPAPARHAAHDATIRARQLPRRSKPRYRVFAVGLVLAGLAAGAAAWVGAGIAVGVGSGEASGEGSGEASMAQRAAVDHPASGGQALAERLADLRAELGAANGAIEGAGTATERDRPAEATRDSLLQEIRALEALLVDYRTGRR